MTDTIRRSEVNGDKRHPEGISGRGLGNRLLTALAVTAVSASGFLLLLATEAPATASDSPSIDFLQPGQDQGDGGRLKLATANGTRSIPNGTVLSLDGDLQMTLTVSPFPPTSFDVNVDMYLTDGSGSPVTNAEINVVWDMIVMWHGPFETGFVNQQNGHYTGSFDMFMFGPWEFVTNVSVPGQTQLEPTTFSIYLWPE